MNKIIIDGYNMIHRVPELRAHLEKSLECGRDELIRLLKTYLLNKKIQITVVFDGTEAPPGLSSVQDYRSLKVVFSRYPFKADPLIISLIAREKAKRSLIVVSDDSEITQNPQSNQTLVLSTHAFYHRLISRQQACDIENKFDRELSQEELNEWLKIFGEA